MKVTNNSMNMNNNFGYGNEFPNISEMQWLMFNAFLIINVESLSLDIATGDIHNDGQNTTNAGYFFQTEMRYYD